VVEVVRRPHKPNLFVQVSVAVISGAAAMYCIQNLRFVPEPSKAGPAVPPAPIEPKAAPAPEPAEPPPAQPDPSIEPPRFKTEVLAPRSMMVVPEKDGADSGIVSVGSDEPVPAAREAAAPPPKKAESAPASKAEPIIHLQRSGLHSPYSGQTIGHGFESAALQPRPFAKKEAPKPVEEEAPVKAAPPRLIGAPRIINPAQIPQKDIFVPSLLHPEVVPDPPFWDRELERKAILAGLVALAGIGYLLVGMGFLSTLVGRPRDDS
jgi:hypothetical protein